MKLNPQKDKYKVLNASENTVKKYAKAYGMSIPKTIKNLSSFAKRLSNFIEKKQYVNYEANLGANLTQADKKLLKNLHERLGNTKTMNKINKELKKLNKIGAEILSNKAFTQTMKGKYDRDFTTFQQINLMFSEYFGRGKNYGEITAKMYVDNMIDDFDYDEMLGQLEEKTLYLDLENFTDDLKAYGFTSKEIKKMAKRYEKLDYIQKDYFIKIIKNFVLGSKKYPKPEEEEDTPTTDLAKDRFEELLTLTEMGITENNKSIY